MTQRFARDESGMTMALTMMMIVLIAVMGAGLLTFVQRDMEGVIENNRGQRALDIAEAGVQAAKSHLRVDSFRTHYDTSVANDCTEAIRVGGEDWSKSLQSYDTSTNGFCTGATHSRSPDQLGVTKNYAGGKFQVTIECFVQYQDSGTDQCSHAAGGRGMPQK